MNKDLRNKPKEKVGNHPNWQREVYNGAHPEDYCQKCGGVNVSWHAENDLFNKVNGSPNGIICPNCFSGIAKEKGVKIWFEARIYKNTATKGNPF